MGLVLGLVELAHIARLHHAPGQLAGGFRRRFGIAQGTHAVGRCYGIHPGLKYLGRQHGDVLLRLPLSQVVGGLPIGDPQADLAQLHLQIRVVEDGDTHGSISG